MTASSSSNRGMLHRSGTSVSKYQRKGEILDVCAQQKILSIVMISDDKFAMPTAVCLSSLKASKLETTAYRIFIIDAGLLSEDRRRILMLSGNGLNIQFVTPTQGVDGLHIAAKDTIASATVSALHKFHIADLLPSEDRVLYLDADTLVREDISWLATEDFQGKAAMVVADSAALYYRHSIVDQVTQYFNSGFMMLDLNTFRAQGLANELVLTKLEKCSGKLVDQDAFNLVLEGKVRYLSIRYNCLCANLKRAERKLKVSDINQLYLTDYLSLEEVFHDAAIVHFASHDKPWKFNDVPFWGDWLNAYKNSPYHEAQERREDVKVSIIIPVYNIDRYLPDCLDSIIAQSCSDIEIICVNDGSSDRSSAILAAYAAIDERLIVINQENCGQSTARNVGLDIAQGKYCYFMDGDDILDLNAIQSLYELSESEQLDMAFFDGVTFYENDYLADRFANFKKAYQRKIDRTDTYSGIKMLNNMMELRDFKPSVCLQFFRSSFLRFNQLKFEEKIIYEDNLFSLQAILLAERCQYLSESFFNRRIRSDSTMTSPANRKSFVSNIVVASQIHDIARGKKIDNNIREFCFERVDYFLSQAKRDFAVVEDKELIDLSFDVGSTESLFDRLIRSQPIDFSKAIGTAPADNFSNLSTTVRKSIHLIRQTRRAGQPVAALRMVRKLSPGAVDIAIERALAEALSFMRRLRNGFKKVVGIF